MKYLQLYESFKKEKSLEDFIKKHGDRGLLEDDGLTFYCNFQKLGERLDNLKGVEKYKNIEYLTCYGNNLKNLKGIEELTNLIKLNCSLNELTSLKEIENLNKLEYLDCSYNLLTNLDEIKNLSNLTVLKCQTLPLELPLPKEWVDKFGIVYEEDDKRMLESYRLRFRFSSYKFQKEFLTKYPERVMDLEPFGFHKRIKQEFPALVRGKEWGFFDLERNEK